MTHRIRWMVYLLNMVIFHGYVSHNQRVSICWDHDYLPSPISPGFLVIRIRSSIWYRWDPQSRAKKTSQVWWKMSLHDDRVALVRNDCLVLRYLIRFFCFMMGVPKNGVQLQMANFMGRWWWRTDKPYNFEVLNSHSFVDWSITTGCFGTRLWPINKINIQYRYSIFIYKPLILNRYHSNYIYIYDHIFILSNSQSWSVGKSPIYTWISHHSPVLCHYYWINGSTLW